MSKRKSGDTSAEVVDLAAAQHAKQAQKAQTKPQKVNKTGKCPICAKPAKPEFAPFCSKRCADVDLGKWLGEGYRIPTDEVAGFGDGFDGEEY